jgi:HD-like signal output (HDOD) protein
MAQLAGLISRDATLSARVLSAANSSAYASSSGVVSTVLQAVRQIGFSMVRNIAAAVGIFDAMPASGQDGFNPLRCWQHCFAVAQFCEQIEYARKPENAGAAYVVGLCHDLGEILLRTQFGAEYQKVLEVAAKTGQPRRELEMQMLGMTRQQLIVTITQSIGLPDSIRLPIEAFHNGKSTRDDVGRMSGILRLAEHYANGLLLATGPESSVAAFTRSECRSVTGVDEPPTPDPERVRAEVFSLTAMLARLKPSEEAELIKPIYPKGETKIWLARDPALSGYDPVQAALSSLATVQVHPRLPTSTEVRSIGALMVLGAKDTTAGFCEPDLRKVKSGAVPVLWAVGTIEVGAPTGSLRPQSWPVSLEQIVEFIDGRARVKQAA